MVWNQSRKQIILNRIFMSDSNWIIRIDGLKYGGFHQGMSYALSMVYALGMPCRGELIDKSGNNDGETELYFI